MIDFPPTAAKEPVGAPGDPITLQNGFRDYSGDLPQSTPEQDQSSWYEPAHTLRNRAIPIKPGIPTLISSQNAARKFVQFTNWSGNADPLYFGDSALVSEPLTGKGGQNTGFPLTPGSTASFDQREYDGPIWVVTDAGAGIVVVIVSDPAANV